MKQKSKKLKLLAFLLTFALVAGMLPSGITTVLADDGGEVAEETGTTDPVEEQEESADSCKLNEGCTLQNGHGGDCVIAETEEAEEIIGTASTTENTQAEEGTEETSGGVIAAASVQAMIDAMPSVDELAAMDTEEQSEVYIAFLAACEAYDALSVEDQDNVDDSLLDEIANYFNGLVSVASENGTVYVAKVNDT